MDHVERRTAVLEFLKGSDRPLTPSQVAKEAFGLTSSKGIQAVAGVLEELRVNGDVFEYPSERTGYQIRFACIKPSDWLADKILSKVQQAGGRVTLRQLRESLRKWERPYFDEAMGQLVRDKKLFYLTVRYKYVVSSPPEPYDHLLPRQITTLREILERINRHRKNALTVDDLRTFLNGHNRAEISSFQASGKLSEDLLLEWYHKDLPKRGGLASVPIPWTWSQYKSWCISQNAKADLAKFQDFMRHLHRAGKIELIPHSMTQSLSEQESEVSLEGPRGEVFYYWKWR